MPRLVDTIRNLGHKEWFPRVMKRVAPAMDRATIKLSGGRLRSGDRGVMPTLLLTHTGRKSGRERQTPLLFVRDGDRLVIAGSNWGQEHDPAWALNLVANPSCRVQVGRERREVVARVAEGEERERLWKLLLEKWPAYDTYEERSGRTIKVFVLEPA
jgi:deazaflavin-dependent oxidoreductase (nitroreductase family)